MARAATIEEAEGIHHGFARTARKSFESADVKPLTAQATFPVATGRLIELMCEVRRDRQEFFPGPLSSDACWDILLQLYRAHLDQHRLNISRLTRHARLPGTTVLRSLDTLCFAGLAIRSNDRLDRRRINIELSSAGIAAMNRFFMKSGTRVVLL